MSWQEDAFSVKFPDLVAKYPERTRIIFRYKVKNYQETRLKVLATPYHDLFMHLSEATTVTAVLDNYQDDYVSRSTGSNQEPGSQRVDLNDSPTYLIQDFAPADIHSEIYVYSDIKFDTNVPIRTERIFKRKLASTTDPETQIYKYKSELSGQENHIRNVLVLNKWNTFITAESSSFIVFSSDTLKYLKSKDNIQVTTDGIFGEFEVLEQKNGSKAQMDYVIDTSDRKYIILQANATKIKPTLTLSTDTFDKTKTLDATIAQKFITGDKTYVSAKKVFGIYATDIGAKDTELNTAVTDLWHAFTTVIFNSNQYLSKYQEYRIADQKDQNFGIIKFDELKAIMYGVATTDELANDPDQVNEAILTSWEQSNAKVIEDNPDLSELMKRVRLTLGMLGQYVPTSSSYGSYDKINKIAFNYSFIPEDMTIKPDPSAPATVDFKMRLISQRYVFDTTAKKIKNIKDQFTIASSNKTFELDEPLTLNQPPEKFIEVAKTSRAGSVDISNPNFLNYMWLMELPTNVDYAQILGKSNPLDTSAVKSKSMSNDHKSADTLFGLTSNGATKTGAEVATYINEHLEAFDREADVASAKVTVVSYKVSHDRHYVCGAWGSMGSSSQTVCLRMDPHTVTTIHSDYLFEWTSNLKKDGETITKLQLPYNLTLASLQDFKDRYGIGKSTFLLKPEVIIGGPGDIHKLTKASVKTALDSRTELTLKGVFEEEDPNDSKAVVEVTKDIVVRLKENEDQTIIQKGIIY